MIDAADRRWERKITRWMVGLLSASFVVTCAAHWERPKWSGAYFPNDSFEGEPIRRWDRALRFDWANRGPFPDFPTDDFSIRWETCLALPSARRVTFLLTSDDGSRLYVNGREVIDNDGIHPRRTRGAEVELAEGVHHLRVEYFEARKWANVGLSASLDGEVPRQIPGSYLRRPVDGRCADE